MLRRFFNNMKHILLERSVVYHMTFFTGLANSKILWKVLRKIPSASIPQKMIQHLQVKNFYKTSLKKTWWRKPSCPRAGIRLLVDPQWDAPERKFGYLMPEAEGLSDTGQGASSGLPFFAHVKRRNAWTVMCGLKPWMFP